MMVPLLVTSILNLKCYASSHAMESAMTGRRTTNFLRHYQLAWTLYFAQRFMCHISTSKFTTKTTMIRTGLISYSSKPKSVATDHIMDWTISRAIGCVDGMLFFPTYPITSVSKHMNTQARKQLMTSAPALTNMIMTENLCGWILLRWLERKETRQTKRMRNRDRVID